MLSTRTGRERYSEGVTVHDEGKTAGRRCIGHYHQKTKAWSGKCWQVKLKTNYE